MSKHRRTCRALPFQLRRLVVGAGLAALAMLTGCGQTGPLFLPDAAADDAATAIGSTGAAGTGNPGGVSDARDQGNARDQGGDDERDTERNRQ